MRSGPEYRSVFQEGLYFLYFSHFFPQLFSNIELQGSTSAHPELCASSHQTPRGVPRLHSPVLFANFAKVTWRYRGVTRPTTTSTACLIIHTSPISVQLGLMAPDPVGGEILHFLDIIMISDAAASGVHCIAEMSHISPPALCRFSLSLCECKPRAPAREFRKQDYRRAAVATPTENMIVLCAEDGRDSCLVTSGGGGEQLRLQQARDSTWSFEHSEA